MRNRAIFKTRSLKTQLGNHVSVAKISVMTLEPSRWKKILCGILCPFNISKPFGKLRQWSSLLVASDSIWQSLSASLYYMKLCPRTILHACLCICSMVLDCLTVRDEFHTTSAYSKRGRMYPLYTVISSSFLKPNLLSIFNI